MTRDEIRLQVAISVIQGVLEAKHGVIGEVVPSIAVSIALRIADAFVEEWYRETKEQPDVSLENETTQEEKHQTIKWTKVSLHPELFFPVKFGCVKPAKGVYGICMHDGVISMIREGETIFDDSYFISYHDLMLIEKES